MGFAPAVRAAVACLALTLSASPSAEAAGGSPEQKYLEESDDGKAEAMLPALLKKWDTPRKCADLLKVLRARKARGDLKKDRDTLEFACPDGKNRQFTYILPPKYSPSKPAGVMIWLHGAIRQQAPGGGAVEAGMFRPAVEDLGFLVIGPSTYDGVEWGTPACRALVRHALRFAKTHFAVDDNRVFLCGDSDGGRGTYAVAETEATFLAAAVPVIGSPGGVTRFLNFRNLPWFAINGDKDGIFPIDHVRQAVEGMKAAGIELEWKVVENGPHDPRFFLQYKAEVQAFLKQHPRDPFPKKVHWCIDPSRGDGASSWPADTFRWIRIEEAGDSERNATFDDEGGTVLRSGLPRVEAVREGNRIEVKTRGVKRVTVLASDAMLDLSKDVEVVVNGEVLFRGRVEPEARAILEEGRRFLDRSLVFANRLTLAVDAAPAAGGPDPPAAPGMGD